MTEQERKAVEIIKAAIDQYKPSAIIATFSGGHDSMVSTHLVNNYDFDLPVYTCSVDTGLAVDGWREWVADVSKAQEWTQIFYKGRFDQFRRWVENNGCPRGPVGHNRSYARLKDRAFSQMLQDYKRSYIDKVLFISGIFQAESKARQKLENPINRPGNKSNGIWVNPCFYWQKADFITYRAIHNLPANPFYETVGGSGDCQCNWGNFITLRKLQKYSPMLAAGNVAEIDRLSRELHGYGWDGKPAGQTEMFVEFEDDGELSSPFLCKNCSRSKVPKPAQSEAEQLALLRATTW